MKRVLAMARETFQESRGCVPPLIAAGGSLLLAAIGLRLPPPMEAAGPPAGAFLHGGLCLIMSLTAMAYGAGGVAADRQSGFSDVLLAKPVTGPVYFLGRFLGIAFRLTLILAGAVLLGALLLHFASTKHARVRSAEAFSMTPSMNLPVLLQPGGPPAVWVFPGEGLDGEASVRFRFRTRYPKGSELIPSLPLEAIVLRDGMKILDEAVEIKNRKSLDLRFPVKGEGDLRVKLRVTGGANFLEVTGNGCRVVSGERGPMIPLLTAALSFLPILYLALAVALLFSTFVSVPTAFFACAVLSLLTLTGPSLKAELTSGPAWVAEARPGYPARMAAEALELLPDPLDGGGLDALSRVECPSREEVLGPWNQGLPHLLIVLVLGSLLAGRKRR